MRYLRLFCLLTLLIAPWEIPVADAQIRVQARAEASYKRGKMVSVSRTSDPVEISGCDRFVLVGTVVSAEYNEHREIVSFLLETQNDRGRKVELAKSLTDQLPSEAEAGLSRLLAKARRIRVVAFGCGGSANKLQADEIKAL